MSDIDQAHQSAEATEAPFNLRDALEAEAARQTADSGETAESDGGVRDDGRDEKGRFAPKEKSDAGSPEDDRGSTTHSEDSRRNLSSEPTGDSAPKVVDGEQGVVGATPPPGWSVASKSAWNDLPEAVRADIAKREREVSDGFKQYSGMGDIKPYAEHFASQGGSLKQALDSYMGFERVLGQNFAGGIELLCRQYNVDPRSLAQHMMGQGGQPVQQDPNAARIAQLEQMFANQQRMAAEQEQAGAQQTIEQFASDPKHLFFENVKVTMGHLIQTGQAAGLEDAYDKAIWMHPEIRPQLLKQQQAEAASVSQSQQRQAAATQARQSAKSLTGSPTPGGSSVDRSQPRSIREIALEAARAQGVSV